MATLVQMHGVFIWEFITIKWYLFDLTAYFMCVCAHACACAHPNTCTVQKTVSRTVSLLCESWQLNSGCPAWPQSPLLAEVTCWPGFTFLNNQEKKGRKILCDTWKLMIADSTVWRESVDGWGGRCLSSRHGRRIPILRLAWATWPHRHHSKILPTKTKQNLNNHKTPEQNKTPNLSHIKLKDGGGVSTALLFRVLCVPRCGQYWDWVIAQGCGLHHQVNRKHLQFLLCRMSRL